MRFRGPPTFERHHQRPLDSPFLKVDGNAMGYGVQTLEALVGRETSFIVRARDPNPEDVVSIFVNEDPGLPTGAVLESGVCVEGGMVPDKSGVPGRTVFASCSENIRVFRWTPPAKTEGNLYKVCFVARDNSPVCRTYAATTANTATSPLPPPRATTEGYYSASYCVQLNVTEARVAWLPGSEPTPAGALRILNVGCTARYVVRATAGQYPVEILPAPRLPKVGAQQQQHLFPISDIRIVTVMRSDSVHDAVVEWTPTRGTEGSVTRVCVVAAPQGWSAGSSKPQGGGDVRNTLGNPRVVGGGLFSDERCFVF